VKTKITLRPAQALPPAYRADVPFHTPGIRAAPGETKILIVEPVPSVGWAVASAEL